MPTGWQRCWEGSQLLFTLPCLRSLGGPSFWQVFHPDKATGLSHEAAYAIFKLLGEAHSVRTDAEARRSYDAAAAQLAAAQEAAARAADARATAEQAAARQAAAELAMAAAALWSQYPRHPQYRWRYR